MKKGFIYILQSGSTGRYYIGSTANLKRRLEQHKSGQTHTTRRMRNLQVVFSQEVSSLAIARKAEMRIKSWKRKDYINKIIKDGRISFLD